MSVTDDIVEEIVIWCHQNNQEAYSRELIPDYLETEYQKVIDEIVTKLKAKGIAVE